MSHLPASARYAWLLVATLLSIIVALVTFMLKRSTGTRNADAILVAGSAFAGCMVLCLGLSQVF